MFSNLKQVYNNVVNSFTSTSAKQAPIVTTTTNNIGYVSSTSSGTGILGTVTTSGTTYTTNNWFTWNNEEEIRKLKRKLYRIQKSGKWIHEMDDTMFKSICGMLDSEIQTDNDMARDIVFNSKMSLEYRTTLAKTYCHKLWYKGYTRTTVGGQERMRINSYGSVGIGTGGITGSLTVGTSSINSRFVNATNFPTTTTHTAKKAAK